MHFVDDIDLVAAFAGREGDFIAQVAHIVDAGVRGRVYLDQDPESAFSLMAFAIGDRRCRVAGAGSSCVQLTAFASSRAMVVLPVPRGPLNR